jgi:hypothetical protein
MREREREREEKHKEFVGKVCVENMKKLSQKERI